MTAMSFTGDSGGPNSRWWKGGRWQDSWGSIHVYVGQPTDDHPNVIKGYMLEHRLVFENHYKCCLIPGISVIKHRNKKNWDNRIENLYPQTRKQHAYAENKGKVLSDDTKEKLRERTTEQQRLYTREQKRDMRTRATATRKKNNIPSPMKGKHHSEETRKRMSVARTSEDGRRAANALWSRFKTPEERKQYSDYLASIRREHGKDRPMLGRHHSEKARKQMRETRLKLGLRTMLGKHHSPEVIEKIRQKAIERYQDKEWVANRTKREKGKFVKK